LVERSRSAVKPTPLVREPLTTRWSATTTIRGRVLGPRDVPISGALIEVAGFGIAEYSNHRGEFSLAAVGRGGDLDPVLLVSARGVNIQHRLSPDTDPHAVVVRLPIPESDR
jgi:hypothetical protein